MNFFTYIFQGFELHFKFLFVVLEFQEHLFFKASLQAVSVYSYNNSPTGIFSLLEKCFSFLLLILTHFYLSYTTLVTD